MNQYSKKPIILTIILTTLIVGGIMHVWNYQRIRRLGYQFFQQTSELQQRLNESQKELRDLKLSIQND